MQKFAQIGAYIALAIVTSAGASMASDWTRFRGPNGSGVSADSATPPVEWSETKNLKWKAELPGPGTSSPIIVGNRVFITCWTGYGVERERPGDQKDLKRNLLCLDRATGKEIWNKAVPAALPEEEYRGMFAEHGYASHTPTSDGERVYVFFGKSGVFAFDLDGKQLWQKSVGTGDDPKSWGSASSPILYKDLLIVPATVESQSLVALDKRSGKEVWRKQADGFGSTWGTPILVDAPGGKTELVIGVPYEIWSFDPATGKLLWFCQTFDENSMCSSLVAHDGVIYGIEGRSGGSIAVRAGGKGDVTKTHVLWSGRDRGRITSPIYYQGRLYWINGGILNCVDSSDDKRIYQKRLAAGAGGASGEDVEDAPPGRPGPGDQAGEGRGGRRGGRGGPDGPGNDGPRNEQAGGSPPGGPDGAGPPNDGPPGRGNRGGGPRGGGRGGFGRGGGGGGGRGGQDYASPVVAGDKLYFVARSGAGYVVSLDKEFKLLATNRFESDSSGFTATPAISDGQLFIRSAKCLYCVSQ